MEPHAISRALKLRGITQKQIAARLGVTPAAVSSVVNGRQSVRVQLAIATALGMPIDEVFPPKGKAE